MCVRACVCACVCVCVCVCVCGTCNHSKAFLIIPIPHIKGNSILKACRADMPWVC